MTIEGAGVVVTGGSQGLGAALARELGNRKARVVVVARGERPLREVVDDIRKAGGEAHALVADVGDKLAAHALAGAAAALVGTVDLLVHNASTLGPVPLRLLLDTDCEDLSRVLEVNVVGPFRLSKAIVGGMILRDRGLVVHMSSDAATHAYVGWGAYGVSKAALDHLGRIWAAEARADACPLSLRRPGGDGHSDARRRAAGCRSSAALAPVRRGASARGPHRGPCTHGERRARRARGGGGDPMRPVAWPRADALAERLLWIDPRIGELGDAAVQDLADLLRPGDLVVVNDAATLPASLPGETREGATLEVRLVAPEGDAWRCVVFGEGDWRTKTELRPPAPSLPPDPSSASVHTSRRRS